MQTEDKCYVSEAYSSDVKWLQKHEVLRYGERIDYSQLQNPSWLYYFGEKCFASRRRGLTGTTQAVAYAGVRKICKKLVPSEGDTASGFDELLVLECTGGKSYKFMTGAKLCIKEQIIQYADRFPEDILYNYYELERAIKLDAAIRHEEVQFEEDAFWLKLPDLNDTEPEHRKETSLRPQRFRYEQIRSIGQRMSLQIRDVGLRGWDRSGKAKRRKTLHTVEKDTEKK